MTDPLFIKIETIIQINGTMEQAQKVRNEVEDAMFLRMEELIHCGDSECCPGPPRPDQVVGYAFGSSTIEDHLDDEED